MTEHDVAWILVGTEQPLESDPFLRIPSKGYGTAKRGTYQERHSFETDVAPNVPGKLRRVPVGSHPKQRR